jgi:putative transposase
LSPANFYKLKAKYGGTDSPYARRLKQFEDENAKLKHLLASAMFDNVVLKYMLGKSTSCHCRTTGPDVAPSV